MPYTLGRQLVTQDVDLSASGEPLFAKVDLAVPSGKVVVGSGALVTQVWDFTSSTRKPVDDVSNWADLAQYVDVHDGPHPSDTSKWRFLVDNVSSGGGGNAVRVQVWIAVANAS